jgi:hypothetical protein
MPCKWGLPAVVLILLALVPLAALPADDGAGGAILPAVDYSRTLLAPAPSDVVAARVDEEPPGHESVTIEVLGRIVLGGVTRSNQGERRPGRQRDDVDPVGVETTSPSAT